MAESFSVEAVISANITKYKQALEEVFSSTRHLKDISKLNAKGISDSFKSVGGTLTKAVSLPLLGIGAASVKTAADFEAAMSEVKAISGATGNDFQKLEDIAKYMGRTTKFTALDSAEALKYMGMAGWKADQMVSGLPAVMNLAAASGEELGIVSDIVTDSLTAFGLKATDAGRYADVLAAAATNSNTNVGMMGETFKYAAPVAGALGYSVEDTAIAIGLMANAGIKGTMAGTALRSAFTRLVKPTKEVEKGLQMINLGAEDFEGKSLHETIDILRDSFKGLDGNQQAQIASMIFGQRAMSGMLGIINASEEDYNKLADAIYNSEGSAEKMAETMQDNLKGAIVKLMSALEGAAIAIGDVLKPVIEDVAKKINEWVDAFNDLDPKTQEMIVKIGVFVAAIGPVLFIIGSLIPKVKAVGSAFKLLGGAFKFLTSPVGIVITIIVALIATIVYLWNTNEDFRNKVIEIWTAISEFFSNTFTAIKEFAIGVWDGVRETWEAFTTWVTETWTAISEFFTTLWDNIKSIAGSVWDSVCEAWQGFTTWVTETFESLKGVLEGIWQNIKSIAGSVWELIKIVILTPILILLQLLTGDWEGAKESLKQIWEKIKDNAKNIWENLKTLVSTIVTKVVDAVKTKFEDMKSKVSTLMENLKTSVSNIWENIKTAIRDKVDQIKTSVTDKFNELKTNASNKVAELKTSVSTKFTDMLTSIITTVSNIPREVKTAFTNAITKAKGALAAAPGVGRNLIMGFVNGVKAAAGRLVSAVKGAVKGAIDGAKRILGIHSPSRVFMKFGEYSDEGFAIGISENAKKPIKAMNKMSQGVIDAFNPGEFDFVGDLAEGKDALSGIIESKLSVGSDERVKPLEVYLNMGKYAYKGFVSNIFDEKSKVVTLEQMAF